ncbi:terminase small subunit [Emticicia sp. 17c]|uniref:terminase small subunit n=1 Tax=Emticicia sp. 17c TaxID=3127704 RepID=UPI00301DC9E6
MAQLTEKQYYQLRSKNAKDKAFKTPAALIEACNAYFEWCLDNPLIEEKVFQHQGRAVTADVKITRPFTLEGLCNYIDLSTQGFKEYESEEAFSPVVARIRQIIETQQFEGVAAGLFNANIIARKLGLTEKKDTGEGLVKSFFDFLKETSANYDH